MLFSIIVNCSILFLILTLIITACGDGSNCNAKSPKIIAISVESNQSNARIDTVDSIP